MKFLIFEWMVGGGLFESDSPLDQDDAFFEQGSSMFSAIANDLITAGHQVIAPLDARIYQSAPATSWAQRREYFDPRVIHGQLPEVLRDLATEVDHIMLIAPESDGVLAQCYGWLKASSDKWFGGPLPWIELASDKNLMQLYLASNGVAVPSCDIEAGFTWVAKPNRGAGSDDVQIFSDADRKTDFEDRQTWRVEQFVPGKSVSVSIVSVGDNRFLLPPTGQIFDRRKSDQNDSPIRSIGTYRGAEYPLKQSQIQRAIALAKQTGDVLPEFSGYIGIDMILADTGPDVVIEINPRMTTSYCYLPVGLRSHWLEAFGR